MGYEEAEIKKHIFSLSDQYMANKKIYGQICKVIFVDENQRLCDVTPINGDSDREVRIQASLNLTEGVYIKPKVGSYVLIDYINIETGVITSYSEIEDVVIKTVNSGEIRIFDKILIKNNNEDLKSIMNDILTAIQQITVPTPSGTSGVPVNAAEFSSINTRINNLLE